MSLIALGKKKMMNIAFVLNVSEEKTVLNRRKKKKKKKKEKSFCRISNGMLIDVNRMTMSLLRFLFDLETNQETLESIKTFYIKTTNFFRI